MIYCNPLISISRHFLPLLLYTFKAEYNLNGLLMCSMNLQFIVMVISCSRDISGFVDRLKKPLDRILFVNCSMLKLFQVWKQIYFFGITVD